MPSRSTLKCFECKKVFNAEALIKYTPITAATGHYYCPDCLKEKQAREQFVIVVCKIFGLKSPGPRIWAERKRIKEKLGYTDEVIIDCLKYLYEECKVKKLADSLYLINPQNIEKMQQWKKVRAQEGYKIARAINTEMEEYIVPIKDDIKKDNDGLYDLDEWLDK